MTEPVRTRILFERLVTMTGREYEGGEVWVKDGRVESIRDTVTPDDPVPTIDLTGHLLLPGFVNAHSHMGLCALEGRLTPGTPFADWILDVVAANTALGWTDRVGALHRHSQSMLRSGVTLLGDYLAHPELLVELAGLPFRQVLFLETLGFPEEDAQARAARVESLLEEHESQGGRIRLGIAPHAPYSVSPQLFRRLKAIARRYRCPMSCHVAEVPEENEFLLTGNGPMRHLLEKRGAYDAAWQPPAIGPVAYLDRLGALEGLVGVHLNDVTADVDLLARRNVTAVFCPGSTCWFGREQYMPVRQLVDRGVPVGLGTDSLASNESLNFLRELKLAESMLPNMSRAEILTMATRWGAEALHSEAGTVEPGRPADLIAFRMDEKSGDWFDIPFESGREEVDWVMIYGTPVPTEAGPEGER
ncbi:amidohydrolase family protein [Nitrospina gracilis]|uniref:amidohydrolase family protein n=1 Tax=Nitrospina gracilis TaxID=35801 RepID=UPI001F21700F|nr:amidohydrolase family protein [Nitrospina gracilis]MCF8721755.1 cytosine/adenosine deaminase-related metal-dependent hydrolase [Nitrospina gracilis Nb-211]